MTANQDLDHAFTLADTADVISTSYFHSTKLIVTTKPDATPVTQADTEVEQALSNLVKSYGEGYVGEEGARAQAKSSKHWIVDPIDGTKNFMRGMPVWATLIGLYDGTTPLVSVVSAPALGKRWWATKDGGAWTRDVDGHVRQLHVSEVTEISNAFLLISSLFAWDKTMVGTAVMLELLKSVWRERAVGDFWGHMLVAEGAADVSCEPAVKSWDVDSLRLIVTEAGGSVWTNDTPKTLPEESRAVISSNGKLEAAVRTALRL